MIKDYSNMAKSIRNKTSFTLNILPNFFIKMKSFKILTNLFVFSSSTKYINRFIILNHRMIRSLSWLIRVIFINNNLFPSKIIQIQSKNIITMLAVFNNIATKENNFHAFFINIIIDNTFCT